MNRSVRNGLAIAGMAGGLFFLGQAVASASDQVADASNNTDQISSTESDGGNLNGNLSEAEAKNVDITEVETNVSGGNAGTNTASVNTGIVPGEQIYTLSEQNGDGEHEDQGTTVDFTSGSVTVNQEANGGDVNHSGDVTVADTGSQTATATNTVNQTAISQGDEHGRNNDDYETKSFGSERDSEEGGNTNLNGSSAEATNIHKVDVDTDINGGHGGVNYADINTGIIGNTFYCPEHSTCTYNFTTGNVTVNQSANGGNVNGSGNVNVGGSGEWPWCDCNKDEHRPVVKHEDCPKDQHQPEGKPAVMPAAKPMPQHSAPVSASAQPSGQLAFTGSDVSLPLTVGLLALAAGIGLTAAGRRRETQTV
jgi:hypothetical protein